MGVQKFFLFSQVVVTHRILIYIFNDAELTEIYGEGMAEMLNKVMEDLQSFPVVDD